MSGDSLAVFLFLVGSALAALLAAVTTQPGWRAWLCATTSAVFGIAAVGFVTGAPTPAFSAGAWNLAEALAPFLSVLLSLMATSRARAQAPVHVTDPQPAPAAITAPSETPAEPPKLAEATAPADEPSPPKPINPSLTATFLNDLVDGKTALEVKKQLEGYSEQRARLTGQVQDVRPRYNRIDVTMLGIVKSVYQEDWANCQSFYFREDQASALAILRPGDWIEFSGEAQPEFTFGWTLANCEFIGRATAPRKHKAKAPRVTAANPQSVSSEEEN